MDLPTSLQAMNVLDNNSRTCSTPSQNKESGSAEPSSQKLQQCSTALPDPSETSIPNQKHNATSSIEALQAQPKLQPQFADIERQAVARKPVAQHVLEETRDKRILWQMAKQLQNKAARLFIPELENNPFNARFTPLDLVETFEKLTHKERLEWMGRKDDVEEAVKGQVTGFNNNMNLSQYLKDYPSLQSGIDQLENDGTVHDFSWQLLGDQPATVEYLEQLIKRIWSISHVGPCAAGFAVLGEAQQRYG